MFRHKRSNTLSHHIATAYDGRALGRDDPVWPCYVNEATKWDSDLMQSWNKSMDSLLLLATLFSAVVTAFLIETYKGLNPDYGEVTAENVITLVKLARIIASGQNLTSSVEETPIPSSSGFKPTKICIIVNTLWFSSLTLSITTALLALLVKQWTEGYLFGHGLTTSCIQARIRQARYDKLKSWKTEEIVLSLPIIMHAALWSFLLGLLIFLADLHPTVLAPVMVFVIITLAVYLLTSLAPLAFAFCPYNTPLSGRKLWGLCYWLFHQADLDDKDFSIPPCQREEKLTSEITVPDSLTARAVEWLVKHSRDQKSIDIAIRAISSPMLEVQVWKNLAQGSLLALISQRFTSILNGTSYKYGLQRSATLEARVSVGEQLKEASLYARALANVIKYASLAPVSGTRVPRLNLGFNLVNLNKEQIAAVENGLRQLALKPIHQGPENARSPVQVQWEQPNHQNSSNPPTQVLEGFPETSEPVDEILSPGGSTALSIVDYSTSAAGITSLSAWYTAVGRTSQTQQEWKETLSKSVEILLLASRCDRADDHQGELLDEDALVSLAKMLPVEISYWRWDLSQDESAKLLRKLVNLFSSDLLNRKRDGPTRGGLSAAIAVLAIMINDYPDPDIFHKYTQLVSEATEYDSDIATLYQLSQNAYNEVRNTRNESQKARRRLWRAQWMARICMADSKFLQKHSDAMLLLGIAGLLESFVVLGLREYAPQIAQMAFVRLADLPPMAQSQPITLPFVLPPTFDIKSYAIDIISRTIYTPYTAQLNPFSPQDRALLLQCLSKNRQLWVDFGTQLLLPVLGLLKTTEEPSLCIKCLDALDGFLHTNPTPILINEETSPAAYNSTEGWKMFFDFEIPHRLVRLVDDGGEVRPKAVSIFRALTRMIPTAPAEPRLEPWEVTVDPKAKEYLVTVLRDLALDGLLPVLAKELIFKYGDNLTMWWKEILALPDVLNPHPNSSDSQILEALKGLSNDPALKNVGKLVASSLKGEIAHRHVGSLG